MQGRCVVPMCGGMHRPFDFFSAASLTRYTGLEADNLRALSRGLKRAHGGAIFYHLHHALFRRHFTRAEFMNDFARWTWTVLHEERLAERLAAIDPLEFVSLADARKRLCGVVDRYLGDADYIQHVPEGARFHFVEAQTFVFAAGECARDLREFAERVRKVGPDVIFHHFVVAPLRLGRLDNDFSAWIEGEWERPELAARLRNLSPYGVDLFELRDRIAELVRQGL